MFCFSYFNKGLGGNSNGKDIFVELNFLIMIIDDALPKFDLPVDFVTDDSITGDILNQYGRFPCHIKAGVFVLCTRGTVRATINLSEYTITHNDFVTVLPGSFIQIHEVSSDTRVCFAGFSSEFISRVSYVETYLDFLPMILDNPIMTLQEEVAQLYRNAFSLLIRAYSLPNTLDNKEILMSILLYSFRGWVSCINAVSRLPTNLSSGNMNFIASLSSC